MVLAAAAIADAFVYRARSGPKAGLCPHPCQDILATIPRRLDRGEGSPAAGHSTCISNIPQMVGTGEPGARAPGARLGSVRAEPSTLQPIPTAGSLGMVPRLADPRPVHLMMTHPLLPHPWGPAGKIQGSLQESSA